MKGRKVKNSRELLGFEPVSLMIKKSRLRWFGYVERKDDNDWVKRCLERLTEFEGIRQTGRPKKTWLGCVKNDMESLGLSHGYCFSGSPSLTCIGLKFDVYVYL